MANGHRDAFQYPIGMLYDEMNLVLEREHNRLSVEAVLAQHAHGAVQSKRGGSAFQKVLRKLEITTAPKEGLLNNKR